MKSKFHTSATFGTTLAKLIEPIFESFYKDILLSEISLPHRWLFKKWQAVQFLTIFNKLLLQMKSRFKYKHYEAVRRFTFSEKVTVLKKCLLLKTFFFWKSSCLEELFASKKYMLHPTNFLFSRSSSSRSVAVLKMYLSWRNSWSEKVFITKKELF